MYRMYADSFGMLAANSIRSIDTDQQPLVLILSRQRGSTEIINIMRGSLFSSSL